MSTHSVKLRGAIVGCGMVAKYHLLGWQRIPNVEIVSLCDLDVVRAKSLQTQYAPQASCHNDLVSMLNQTPLDFVDILTPPWMHREHCLLAADFNTHIICQKPICDSLAPARDLVHQLRDYQKLFAIHENHPWRPWFREVVRLKNADFFGGLRFLRLMQHDAFEPSEQYKCEAIHGVLLEYGVHLIAMARTLLGDPRHVTAWTDRINPRVRGESLAHLVLEFSEATAIIDIAWKPQGQPQGGLVLIGDAGEATYEGRMTRDGEALFSLTHQGTRVRHEQRLISNDFTESFYLLQREFVACILENRHPEQSASENLQTIEIAFAAYRAAEAQTRLPLRYDNAIHDA